MIIHSETTQNVWISFFETLNIKSLNYYGLNMKYDYEIYMYILYFFIPFILERQDKRFM